MQGHVSPTTTTTTTNYLTYRIGLDDVTTAARSHQSSQLLLQVRESTRSHSTPLPCSQATVPVLACEAQGSPTERDGGRSATGLRNEATFSCALVLWCLGALVLCEDESQFLPRSFRVIFTPVIPHNLV